MPTLVKVLILILIFKAILLDKFGRKEDALKSYNKMIELTPNVTKAYYNRGLFNSPYIILGLLLYELGKMEDALKSFNKAIELGPKEAKHYSCRGFWHSYF